MKLKALLAAMFLSATVVADTTYELTIEDGVYTFSPINTTPDPDPDPDPDSGSDPVPVPTDPALAEIEYCQNFDTSQGLTFAYVEWQKRCDTNKDGEYKFCEDWTYPGPINFSYVWWYRGCLDDPEFTPVN